MIELEITHRYPYNFATIEPDDLTWRVNRILLGGGKDDILKEIDSHINASNEFKNRSDFIRHLIKNRRMAVVGMEYPSVMIHQKTFVEMIRTFKNGEIEKLTKRTAQFIHSAMQDKKKSPLKKIKKDEALLLLKEIYESMGIIKNLHYKREDGDILVCMSGENLQSKICETCRFEKTSKERSVSW